MRVLNLFTAAILVIPAVQAGAYAGEAKKALAYEDYMKKIESTLPEIKSNSIDVLQAENEVKRAKGDSDVSLSAGGEGFSGNQYSGTDTGKTDGYTFQAGAEKKFTSTGTILSTTYDYSKYSYSGYSSTDDYSTYKPSLTVKVTQPLLYNFLGKVDQYSEKNAKMQYEIEKLKLSENNRSVLKSYRKLYFQWISYGEIVKNLEKAIKNSRAMKNQTLRKVKAGLADNDDYQKTITSLLSYESQYRDYRKALKNVENQLSVYFDVSAYEPDRTLYEKWVDQARSFGYDSADFGKTTSAKIIEETMKNYQYSKGVYENKLLPEFNVFAEAARKDIGESTTFAMNDSEYTVGFEFTYKLGNNSAESSLKDVDLQMKSLRLEYDSTLKNYTKNMLIYRESASGTKDVVSIQEAQLKALNSQLKTEKKKYSQARLNLSYVIDTENSITSGMTELINYKYELIGYYIDYLDLIK